MVQLRERCIVIDDDPDMAELVEQLVRPIGLDVESYTRPVGFLRDFRPDGPDVIVSDLIMPEMTGIELLNSMHIQRSPLPFIIVTGFADVEASVSAFRAGAFDFIEKPISRSLFLSTVQRALALSRLRHAEHEHQQGVDFLAARLTSREALVLSSLVSGASNKEVARRLGISHRTVEHHRQSGFSKLAVHSVVELGSPSWRDALQKAAGKSELLAFEFALSENGGYHRIFENFERMRQVRRPGTQSYARTDATTG